MIETELIAAFAELKNKVLALLEHIDLMQQKSTPTITPEPNPEPVEPSPVVVDAPVATETVETPKVSPFPQMVLKWAESIAKHEGATPASHNPGNLKYTSLTAGWGATQGHPAEDGGFLCDFSNDEAGMNALCNFLMLGCRDELLAFHSARTLYEFTVVYAGNPPAEYITGIEQDLGVPGDTLISSFLE